ncbi:hypothetical protein O6H91_13G051800 [Diphasiastrum complanatum]|uniref:Uncharacterized protein n=1 Tax=Diphasiastrum complanatum TaxID=34168 RepID=A0ACC2BUR4_DIPCM|nr:hypothetical protein O6H91_13G051800 [Diphasiastrum complanatum]
MSQKAAQPLDIVRNARNQSKNIRVPRRTSNLKRQSSLLDNREALERRGDQNIVHYSDNKSACFQAKAIERNGSDQTLSLTDRTTKILSRTASLTDRDLEELRGCIDLGFVFSDQADPEMWNTIPASELCYAISQQLKDTQIRYSPRSTLDGGFLTDSSSSTLVTGTWTISSPGDDPCEVKTRLRHWAKAVAFTVRQSF